MAAMSITRVCEAEWKSRKWKITCNRQFPSPLSCLSPVDFFPVAAKYNQDRVPLIYSLWGCTRVPIFLGPETEVKRIACKINLRNPDAQTKSVYSKKCGKIKSNQFLGGNFPQDSLYLDISFFVNLRTMSSKNISETLSFVPDIESAEKLLHEHEVETTTSFVVYYSYGVGKGKS